MSNKRITRSMTRAASQNPPTYLTQTQGDVTPKIQKAGNKLSLIWRRHGNGRFIAYATEIKKARNKMVLRWRPDGNGRFIAYANEIISSI